jgi:hypothetical protein
VAGWVTILVGVTVVVLLAADGLWLVAGLTTVWWPLPVWGVINAIAPWRVRERARRGQVGGIFG